MNSPTPLIIFYAPTVYTGGGKLLLIRALKELSTRCNLIAILSDKVKKDIYALKLDIFKIYWIEGTIKSYIASEILLHKLTDTNSKVLCFHGLPPILCRSKNVFIYAQNKLLFEKQNVLAFPLRLTLLIFIQKILFISFGARAKVIFTQTESMKSVIYRTFKNSKFRSTKNLAPNILVTPFASFAPNMINVKISVEKKYDFSYPSTALPHKNHRMLIEAWKILASEDIYPSLALPLTIPDFNLENLVAETNAAYSTKIYILNNLNHKDCLGIIQSSSAIIYPSLTESFGLPLIEANFLGIPVIASDLGYVYDVCNPVAVFNPYLSDSISEAVKGFINEMPALVIKRPVIFVDKLGEMCDALSI